MALGVRVVSNTTTHPNKAFWEASLLVAILLVVLLVSLCSWGGGWLWGNSDGSSPRKPRSDPPTSTGAPASTPSPPGAPPQDPPDSPTTPPGTSPRSTDSSGTDSDSGGSHDDEEDGTRSPGNAVNSRVPPGFNAQTYHLPGGNTVILRTPIDETDREGRTTTITTGGMNRPVTDGQGGRSAYIPFEVPRSSFPGNTTFAQQQGRPAQSGASPAVQLPPSQQQHPAPPGEPRAVNLPPVTPLSPNVINLQPTIRHTPVNVRRVEVPEVPFDPPEILSGGKGSSRDLHIEIEKEKAGIGDLHIEIEKEKPGLRVDIADPLHIHDDDGERPSEKEVGPIRWWFADEERPQLSPADLEPGNYLPLSDPSNVKLEIKNGDPVQILGENGETIEMLDQDRRPIQLLDKQGDPIRLIDDFEDTIRLVSKAGQPPRIENKDGAAIKIGIQDGKPVGVRLEEQNSWRRMPDLKPERVRIRVGEVEKEQRSGNVKRKLTVQPDGQLVVDIMDSETETEGNNVERRAKVGFKVAEGEEPSPESKRRRAAQATSEAAGTTASRKRTVVELDAEDEKRRGDDPAAEKEERARTPKDKAKEKATEPGIRIVKKDDKVVVEAFEFAGEPEIIDETTGKAGKKKKSVRKVKVANGETVMIADTDEEEAAKPYKKKDKSKRVKVVNGQTSMLSDGDDEREVIDERTGKPIGKKKKRLKKVKVVGGQTVTTTDTDGEVEVVNGKKKGRKSAKESTSDSKLEDRLQELEDARDSDMIAARKARREERLRQRLDPESDQDTTPMKRSARKRRDLAAQQDYDDDDSGGQNQSSSRLSRSRNAPTRDDPNAPDYYRAPQQQVQAQAPPIPAAATQYQPVPMPMAMPASAPSQPAYIPSAPAAAPSAPAAAAAPVPVIVQQGGGPVPMQMPTQMYTTPNNGSGQNIPVGQQAGPSRPPEEPTVPISSMSNQKPKAKSVVVETESEAEAEEKSAFKGKGHKLGKKPDDKPPEAPPLEVKREATPTAPEVESPPLTPLSSLPSAPIDGARPEQLELEPVTDSDDDLETRLRQNDPKKYEQFMAAEAERRREVPRVVEGGLKEGLSDSVGPDNTFSTLQNKRATNEQMTMAQEEDPTDYRTGGNNKAWDEEYRRGESAPTGRITNTQFDKGEGVIPDDTAISESSRDTERATKDTPLTTSLDAPDLRTAKSDPLPVPMDQESIESSQQQWKDSRPLGNIKPEQNRIDKMDLTLKDRPQEAWRDSGPQKKGKEKDDGQRNSRIGIPIAEKLSDEAWREERPSPTKLSGGKPSLSDSSTAAWEDEQSSGSRIDQKATVGFKSDAINDTDQRSDRAWREVKPSPIETSHEIPELAESPGREWRKKRPLSAERDTFTGVEGRKTVNQGGMMLASSIDRSKVEAGETPGGSRGSKSSPPEGKIMDQPASDLGGSLDSKHQKEKPLRTDENEVAEQQAVLQTGSQKAEASGRTAPPSAVSASKHEEGHMPSDMAWLEERPSPLRPSHEAPELPESPGREWRNERPSPVKSEASMPIETDPVAFGRPGMMLPSAVDRSKIEAYQPPLDSPSWSEEAGQRLGGKGKEKNHDPFPELMNIESTGRETSPLSGKQAKNDDQPSFNATPSALDKRRPSALTLSRDDDRPISLADPNSHDPSPLAQPRLDLAEKGTDRYNDGSIGEVRRNELASEGITSPLQGSQPNGDASQTPQHRLVNMTESHTRTSGVGDHASRQERRPPEISRPSRAESPVAQQQLTDTTHLPGDRSLSDDDDSGYGSDPARSPRSAEMPIMGEDGQQHVKKAPPKRDDSGHGSVPASPRQVPQIDGSYNRGRSPDISPLSPHGQDDWEAGRQPPIGRRSATPRFADVSPMEATEKQAHQTSNPNASATPSENVIRPRRDARRPATDSGDAAVGEDEGPIGQKKAQMDATDDIPTPPDHKDSQGKVQVPPLSPMKPRERQSVDPLAVPSDVWGEEPAAKTVKGSDRATPKSTEETPEDKVPSDEAIADNETRSSSKRHEKDTAGNGEERSALTDGKPPPDRRTTEPSIDGPKNGAEEEKADGQDTETSAGQPRKASTEGNSSKRSREKNKEHLSDIDELGSARVTKFGHENRRGLERVQKSDKKPDKVRTRRDAPPNTSKELADTTNNLPLSQASRRTGLRQIIRATWRTISLAPIWSFATLMSAIIVLMGDRQLAQMIINSHSSAAVSRKRALAPDLALTEKINNKDFSTLLSPTEFFILLNIWNFLGLLILSILISATIGGAQRPSLRNTRHTIAKALSGIANILLMGARPRGLSIISRSSWTSYGRLAMFLALLTLVILILQQALAFAFSATSTPNALLDATPDIAGIEKLSHTISAGQILLALMFILAIIIPALTFGWYALLNPPSKTATKDVKADQQLKTRNTRTIMALEAIGAIVILTVFLAVMYFFSEIVAYSGTGSSNLIIANVILVFMIPATGWALIVLSRAGGRIYRSGSRSLFGNDPEKSLV